MTVSELIEKLKEMPQDAEVVFEDKHPAAEIPVAIRNVSLQKAFEFEDGTFDWYVDPSVKLCSERIEVVYLRDI